MKNYILSVLLSFVLSLAFCQDVKTSVERINTRIAEIEQSDDYKIVDMPKVRADIRNGVRDISGLRIYQEEKLSIVGR